MALKRYGLPRNPDCVVVLHGWNDLNVTFDGYSDREKSFWMRSRQWTEPEGKAMQRAVDFRVPQMVAKWCDLLDRSWPRLNVDIHEFQQNFEEMARLCAARSIPLVIVQRPISHGSLPDKFYQELQMRYFKEHHQIASPNELYHFNHQRATNVQAQVALSQPNTRLAGACEALEAQQTALEHAPREGVATFTHDAIHCTPLGNQGIAEVVASAIEPALAPQIKQYLASGAYWKGLALDFQQGDDPFLCAYAVEQALLRAPELSASLATIKAWAQSQFEFWRLFEANTRYNGPHVQLDLRLANLGKCLDMRPSDSGVLASIFQAASWNGRTELALPLLLKFKPSNAQDQYGWLRMLFQAFIAAHNWTETEKVARALLTVNPNDQDAKDFLASWQRARPLNTAPPP